MCSENAVTALPNILYKEDGDWEIRERLKNVLGIHFNEISDEYKVMFDYINTDFNIK